MTREEWEKQNDKSLYKKECKIILTVRGLRRYLNRRQRQGWILTGVTASTYIFRKGDGEACVYTMDSQSLTNKRWKEKQKKFKDKKDWYGLNNDWQTQSLADAAEKGWNFICALENRSIIYCGKQSEVQPLNDAKYDKSLRSVSALGSFVMFLVCCALVGGVIGAALAMLGF